MAKARAVLALQLGLGALGFAVVGVAVAVAAGQLSFAVPARTALLAACNQLFPHLDARSAAVLLLAAVSLVVLVRALSSAIRRLAAARKVVRSLQITEERQLAGLTVQVFSHPSALAFCTGLFRPQIYISTGTIAALEPDELAAVVAHEQHHARARDPLRVFLGGVVSDALFFAPGLRGLGTRYASLAELAADRAAVRRHRGDAAPLASALLALERSDPAVVGIGPERVDHLLGETPRWDLPLALAAWALPVIVGLGALALFVGNAAAGAVSVPLLAAQSCMAAMIVGGLAIAAGGLRGGRRLLSRQP